MESETTEILPCPFPGCGGACATVEETDAFVFVGCLECGYTSPCGVSRDSAVAAHNAVASAVRDHAAVVAERDALRAQVAQLRRDRALVHSALRWIAVHASWRTSHVEEWYAHRDAALAATAPGEESAR